MSNNINSNLNFVEIVTLKTLYKVEHGLFLISVSGDRSSVENFIKKPEILLAVEPIEGKRNLPILDFDTESSSKDNDIYKEETDKEDFNEDSKYLAKIRPLGMELVIELLETTIPTPYRIDLLIDPTLTPNSTDPRVFTDTYVSSIKFLSSRDSTVNVDYKAEYEVRVNVYVPNASHAMASTYNRRNPRQGSLALTTQTGGSFQVRVDNMSSRNNTFSLSVDIRVG